MRGLRFPGAIHVYVLTEDRIEGPVVVDAVVMGTDEVLLSDKAIGALKLVLVDAGEGLWRFRDEPLDRLRRSEPPRFY